MKFTLKDYQEDAVAALLERLRSGKTTYDLEGKEVSVSLSATTGAGKTVMAAAVIEALFYGNDSFDFSADPSAVVIWFSDNPNLNDQTRFRLMEASDKLTSTDLVTIEYPFPVRRLEPGKVYFLNTQKLSGRSLLVRRPTFDPHQETLELEVQPDLQGWTLWETIANTIDADDLTLYVVIDEAHRGFTSPSAGEKATVVSKLVNGHDEYPPVPLVLGISATLQRFVEAMERAHAVDSRTMLPPVEVDVGRVQESGLIKDSIVLDIPAEAGNFDTVLVRRAARKLRESTQMWQEYARSQGSVDVVHPLLVLQAPSTPDGDQLGRALDVFSEELQPFDSRSVRHVFGEHEPQMFGSWQVDWIEPQRVQDRTEVRVLVAKDAISTGWDCPRAEVMVSFRPAKDQTHITQLLGRMVRSPLARRIPGDERLNSVECILPFFDRTTAGKVVRGLTGVVGPGPEPPPGRPILEPCHLEPNPDMPESVWDAWDAVPTMTIPKRGAGSVKRLMSLALALSKDGLREGALESAKTEMHRVLDQALEDHPELLEAAVDEIWAVRGQAIGGRRGREGLTYVNFVERADDRAIQVGFGDAKKAFGADVAQSYVQRLSANDEDDDSLREAYVTTSALAIVPAVREGIDHEADALATMWFEQHHEAIRGLPDERQQEYADIQALATQPQRRSLTRPRVRIEDYAQVDDQGQETRAPLVERHLMSDQDGMCPIGTLNAWERRVVEWELARADCVGWYRNPPRQSVDSVGVPYRDAVGNWRSMHPDFIFFNEVNGVVRPSIVDPHGHHLEDALLKLQALASFAAEYGDEFHRILAMSEVGGRMRSLDLKVPTVREAILAGEESPVELYESEIAVDFQTATHHVS